MATVPGVIYFCEHHGQGGNPGMPNVADGLMSTLLQNMLDREVLRITPDNATTGAPTSASLSCWPFYDGNMGTTFFQVASSTTTTITVSPSPVWTTNEWAGRRLTEINTAPVPTVGFRQRMSVISNTADTLTFGATSAPTVGAYFFLGTGRFTDYHPIAGWLDINEFGLVPSSRGGSSFASTGGIGPDATLIRRLFEDVYDEAPYFHLWKVATAAPVSTGWADSPNNSQRAAFALELARVVAAASAHGNTIAWNEAIIDLSMSDLIAAVSAPLIALAYKARLLEMIAWIKTTLGNSDLRVVLVNHDERLWSTTAPLAAHYWRGLHREVAVELSNVAIVDMNGARIGRQIVSPGDTPATEVKYYAQAEYFTMGERMSHAIARLQAGTPDVAAGGMPLYYMIGDSIMVGPANVTWVTNSNSPLISGPNPPSLLRPAHQKILNHGVGVLEVYEPGVNSNTAGTVQSASGPDLSFMAQLGLLHPDGFAVVKVATNGSALASEAQAYIPGVSGGRWKKSSAENYTVLLACRDEAIADINATYAKQADARGIAVSLGHNDHSVVGGGAAFAAELPNFVRDLRADLSTRTSGAALPISWRRPQLDAQGVNVVEMQPVRDALQTQMDSDGQFVFVDADDLERSRDDNLHETPESSVKQGERHVAALQLISL